MCLCLWEVLPWVLLNGDGPWCYRGRWPTVTGLPVLQREVPLCARDRWQHLADLTEFALAMKVALMNINYQSFNNFMLRIGEGGGEGERG